MGYIFLELHWHGHKTPSIRNHTYHATILSFVELSASQRIIRLTTTSASPQRDRDVIILTGKGGSVATVELNPNNP
jgi:hypothetical protein